MRFLDEDDDDPISSVVNLVVIENPGEANMRITVKDGEDLTRYESQGQIGEGQGEKAGSAYRLPNGNLIYVPE